MQHARAVILDLGDRLGRAKELKFHAIPSPMFTVAAQPWRDNVRHHRCIGFPHRAYVHPCRDPHEAARMILISVAQDHRVETRHALTQQGGRQDRAASVEVRTESRTCIHQQRVLRGSHQHCCALAHIEGLHLELPGRGHIPWQCKQRDSCQQGSKSSPRRGSRRENKRAEQGQELRGGRRMQRALPRQRHECIEIPPHECNQRIGHAEQRHRESRGTGQQHRTQSSQRHYHQGNQWFSDHICDRADQWRVAEQQQQQRREHHQHRPLGA